jgi:DNA polymerase-3 subunit gamma/tau
MSDQLINKYRPQSWDYVYGHRDVVTSLQHTLAYNNAHAFLFVGPSGLGKTTLARLIAKSVNATVDEIDAGKYTGIEDMRELTDLLRYRPLLGENKCIILNEVQALSKKAWDSILMHIEEPPEWLYWCLTTTEPTKVPDTIKKGRCASFHLKPVPVNDLTDLLEAISEAEAFKTPQNVIGLCARNADGSPRNAIANLGKCSAALSIEEAASLLEEAEQSVDAIELIRALVAGKGWAQIQPILERLKETNPESIRHVCRAYLTKAIIGQKDPEKVMRYFELLEHFSVSFYDKDQLSPIVLAVGRVLFAQAA